MRLRRLLIATVSLALFAADESPTGPRITPPTVRDYSPRGFARGVTAEMTVEGFNLAGATKIYFSEPGVTAKILRVKELPDLPDIRLGSNGTPSTIDVGPLPPRNQVTLELTIDPEAKIGPVRFRVLTPLGTSPTGTFLIEPFFGETADMEPNNTPEEAQEVFLPTILSGTINRAGDVDVFKIKVTAGQTLTFDNPSATIGSSLSPVVSILDEQQNLVADYGRSGDRTTRMFQHSFHQAGTYYVSIADYQQMSGGFYRIKVGNVPLVSQAFPLGAQRNSTTPVALQGFDLAASQMSVKFVPGAGVLDYVAVRPAAKNGEAYNEVMLSVSDDPETTSPATNDALAKALPITAPITINGKIAQRSAQFFRFTAKKDQPVVIEVNARRLGSDLDSEIEVLTAEGKPIERAIAQPAWETSVVLRDHDSQGRGVRLASWNSLHVGDYVLIGSEIMRVSELPHSPDEDVIFDAEAGQRQAFFGTTAEGHALDQPAYKVAIQPAGTKLPPNGMPIAHLTWRNDDGGSSYGKDSYLRFIPPADGTYVLRLNDVRQLGGETYAYRLHVRAPQPDFRITTSLANPNVPRGGTIPLAVTAKRLDDYDGPINVTLADLPKGLTATKAIIPAGQNTANILLSAAPDAQLTDAAALHLTGQATINGKPVTRVADADDPLRLIALAPTPDITFEAETKDITLEPGGTAEVKVRVTRHNGFAGRVPIIVAGLPPRTRTADVGLNGVLLNETESERTFPIEAFANAEPADQVFWVSGQIETRSGQQNLFAAPQPVQVRVVPKNMLSKN